MSCSTLSYFLFKLQLFGNLSNRYLSISNDIFETLKARTETQKKDILRCILFEHYAQLDGTKSQESILLLDRLGRFDDIF